MTKTTKRLMPFWRASRMLLRTALFTAAALGLFAIGTSNANVIPVSSQVALSANAGIDGLVQLVSKQPTASQAGTLNPLSVSVDNALAYPAGTPPLVGAACNPFAASFCVSVDGQESATWTSASHGTVTFSNYGWHDHLSTSGTVPPGGGASSLIPNLIPPPRPQFTYNFIADISGTMDIHYTVTDTGIARSGVTGLLTPDCFGLLPFDVAVSGGTGRGPQGSAGLGGFGCGTTSGHLVGLLDAGAPYRFFIQNQSNVSGGLGDRFALIDATFDFTIPSSSSPAPEPSTLLLLGTGLLGAVGAARRKWLG